MTRKTTPNDKINVCDVAFFLFRYTGVAVSFVPPGFELRLGPESKVEREGYYHKASGKFVAGWFMLLATCADSWLIGYLPPSCDHVDADLVRFEDVATIPAKLRKAGCKVGDAKLLVQMMKELLPDHSST